MPKRSEAFMQEQRFRILDAAYACFLNKGFRDTSIRDICKESNLSVGAIYVHFENRDAIIASVCGRISAQTTGKTKDDATAEEFVDNLSNLVISCFDNPSVTNMNHQLLADALSSEQMADVYRQLMEYSVAWMKQHLKRFHADGQIEMPFDLDTTAQGLSSILTGFGLKMHFDNERSEDTQTQQLRTLITQLIGVQPLPRAKLRAG
jgi:AcrR family transcriptional regulator